MAGRNRQELVRETAHARTRCLRQECQTIIEKGQQMSVIRTKRSIKQNAKELRFCSDRCATDFLFEKHMQDPIP